MNQINKKLNSIITLAHKLESKPKKFGTDVTLTASDIHLIEIIGEKENCSVTDIARYAGVTKGAVSQKLRKLTNKGFILKREDPENLSRSLVALTSKGKSAFFAHKHWHETMDGGFSQYYKSLSQNEIQIIVKFLSNMEALLENLSQVED